MDVPVRDRLDAIGSIAGLFVALVGLATLIGQPWQYSPSATVMVLQGLGSLVAVGVGVGLVYLAHVVE